MMHERPFQHAEALLQRLSEANEEDRLMILKEELEEGYEWRQIALYLAECHAGTAEHEGTLSRTSKNSRGRFASICEKAAEMVRVGHYLGPFRDRGYKAAYVVERLEGAAKRLRGA